MKVLKKKLLVAILLAISNYSQITFSQSKPVPPLKLSDNQVERIKLPLDVTVLGARYFEFRVLAMTKANSADIIGRTSVELLSPKQQSIGTF